MPKLIKLEKQAANRRSTTGPSGGRPDAKSRPARGRVDNISRWQRKPNSDPVSEEYWRYEYAHRQTEDGDLTLEYLAGQISLAKQIRLGLRRSPEGDISLRGKIERFTCKLCEWPRCLSLDSTEEHVDALQEKIEWLLSDIDLAFDRRRKRRLEPEQAIDVILGILQREEDRVAAYLYLTGDL